MPLKPKPKAKQSKPPPANNHKCQGSNADEQPIKQPHHSTNQKAAKPDNTEKEESDEYDEYEGDPAPWAEVEEKVISKGKVKGPALGRGGNQGQRNQAQGKSPGILAFFFCCLIY